MLSESRLTDLRALELADLLTNELSDAERFRRVEQEIQSRAIHMSKEQFAVLEDQGLIVRLHQTDEADEGEAG